MLKCWTHHQFKFGQCKNYTGGWGGSIVAGIREVWRGRWDIGHTGGQAGGCDGYHLRLLSSLESDLSASQAAKLFKEHYGMQQKAKPGNDLEQTGLRSVFIRLQADIMQSTAWPSSRVELTLSLITYLQMFKYAYDYCSDRWNAPYGVPEAVLFSYLDVSYYERYLPQSIFVNVLYIMMGLMAFYVLCFVYLLKPMFESSLHTIMRRMMRVLLELFAGVLFMPIVHTIVNNQTCSLNVQSNVVPCIVQNNQMSVTIVSYVLLGIFSLLLMVQCTVKYEFIPCEQSKIIRNSSRSQSLFLLYVLANEFAVLFANGLATIIVLNSLAALLLLYRVLVDEFVTLSAKKLQLCFLSLNFALCIITDISYFTTLNVPLLVWVTMSPIIVSIVWLQSSLSIRNELENINKWTTPVDMLRYCQGLRSLLAQSDRPRSKMLINGYCDVHRQKCEEPTCPIRMTPPALRKLRTFNPLATRNKPDEVLMIQELIKKIYSQGVKFFPTNSSLELQFAHFLYNKEMKEQALKQLLQMDLDDASFDQYYKYHRLKYRIHREIAARNTHSCLDMLSELQMNRKQEQFMKLLEKVALVDLQFWGVLNEDHPDFMKLDQIGQNRMKLGDEVEQLYRSITCIGNSQRTTFLYVLFVISVNKHQLEFNDVYQNVREQYQLNKKITIEDWANSSNCIVLFNGEQDKFGNIADLNLSAASFLGYQKYQLLNRNVSLLLCAIFQGKISEFLTGKSMEQSLIQIQASQMMQSSLIGMSSLVQQAQQPQMRYYLIKKNGYCVPITRRIQIFNSMTRGFIYMCTIEPARIDQQQGFIICSQQGKVLGMSSSCISLLGIDLKFISFRDQIDTIFPEMMGQLDILIEKPQRRAVRDLFSVDVVEKTGIQQPILVGEVNVRAERIDQTGFVLIFQRVHPELRNLNYQASTKTCTDFAMNLTVRAGKNMPVVIGVSHGRMVEATDPDQANLSLNQELANVLLSERLNYAEGIRTVRLYDNSIEIIQQSEDGDKLYEQQKQNIMEIELSQRLSRKHQQQIFQSKEKLLQFINGYETGRSIKVVLLVASLLHIGLFVLMFVLYNGHNKSTVDSFSQIVYESRKIGQLQTMYSTMESYEMLAGGIANQNFQSTSSWLGQSIQLMQNIKGKGLKSYPLMVTMTDGTSKSFYSDEFIQSFLNNADLCNSQYGSAMNATALAATNTTNVQFSSSFVRTNGAGSYSQMVAQLDTALLANIDSLQTSIILESVVLAGCYLFEVLFTGLMIYLFYSTFNEKIRVLRIFLSIPEHQILLFSSKSERFLTSLHIEDNEVEDDQEAFTTERTNRNSFAVKKKFKVVKRQSSIYFRFLVIPLLVQIFYILCFTTSQSNLSFMKDGLCYANQTSSAKRIFYNGLAGMQQAVLTSSPITNPATSYINYYQSLFNKHELTFSHDLNYHTHFIEVMMMDICNGTIPIAEACQIDISPNGTLLIFTDMTVITAYSNITEDFSLEYYLLYKIIGRSHDVISDHLITTQSLLTNEVCRSLLNYFFIFLFSSMAVFFFYGLPLINIYLTKINCTKKMVGLLPLSVAKESDEVHGYFQEIIERKKYCLS